MLRVSASLNISTKFTTIRNMSQGVFLDVSPPTYSGFRGTLDKSVFRKSLDVLAAKIPAAQTGIMLKADSLKKYWPSHPSRLSNVPSLPKVYYGSTQSAKCGGRSIRSYWRSADLAQSLKRRYGMNVLHAPRPRVDSAVSQPSLCQKHWSS